MLGNRLHSRELSRQKQEAMICSSVLNKMTSLGMPICLVWGGCPNNYIALNLITKFLNKLFLAIMAILYNF
ncbi:MAG: hypothetical protein ACI9BN_001443 [Francisella sp.]